MVRRKLEIKRIENKSSRQISFSKRRNGLIEKARQLSILCESSVAVLVVSDSGKLYSSSSGNNMSTMINQYKIQHAYELKKLELAEQTKKYLPHKELLEVAQSNLEEPNVVSVDSLSSLEDQLETAMSITRARKEELMMESVKTLQEKGKLLREENQVLASQLIEGKLTSHLSLLEKCIGRRTRVEPMMREMMWGPWTVPVRVLHGLKILVSMSTMINQYKIQHAYELKKLELAEQTKKYLPHKELLEVAQSNLEEPNVDNVSVDSLSSLEDQLETAMSITRARKEELMMESVKTLQEKGKLLREENQVLASQLIEMEKNERAMSSEYNSVNNQPETLLLLK